ncbi:mucin-17-like isoform X3 [Thalassophryne amazonica]|uniref:mucin-17-like isoform X3 n=1 Tax=Thalassophryne amazonica TaxID=390379 RepID=UPI001470DDE8|nr:mucin-17-like isoform X3 [Thalassophryne amazonica]
MARRSQCSLAGDNPLDPNYLHPHYREEYRLAVDALVEEELEGYYQFLQRADVVDFLSPPEIEYIQCSIQLPQQNFPEQPFLESEGDGSSDTYWPIHSDLDAPGLDLGWPPLHRFIGPTEVTTLVNPPEPDMPSIKEQARRLIKNAQQVIAVVMDVFTDVDIFADILQAAMRNVAVYVLLDEQNVRLFLNMASNCRVNLQSIQFLRVRTVCGVTYRCRSGKSIKGRMMDRFLLTDCRAVLGGNYSFMWSFEKLHRCMAHLYLGQLVSTFDEEFRILYAQSQPLTENLFAPMEDFALSLNKQYSSEPHLLSRDPRKFVPIDAYGREEWSRPPADERMDMKWKVMPHKRQAVMHRSVDQGPMDMYSRFPPQQIQIEPAFDLGSSRMPMMENPAFKRHSFAEGSLGRHSPYPFPQEQGISDFETQGRQFQRGQLPYQKMRSEVDYGGYEKFWSHAYLSSNQYSEPVFQQEMEPPESYNQMLNYVPFATDVYQGSEKLLGVPFTSARPRRSSAGQIYACQTSPPSSHMPDSQFFEEPNTDRKDPAVKRGLRTWRINSFLSAFDNGEDEDLRMTPTNVDTFDEPSNTIQQMAFGTDLSLPKIPDIREVKVPLVPRVSQLPSYIRSTTPTAAITQEPEKKIPEDCTAIVPETKITPTPSDSSSATEGDKTEEVEQKEPKTSVLRRDESFRRKYNAAVQTSSRLRSSLIFSSQLDPHVYQESKTAPGQQDEDDDKNEDEQTKLPFISQVLGQKRLVREPFEWSRYIKSTSLDTTATETSKSDDVSNKLYDKDSSKEKMSKDPSESQEKTTEALSSKSPDTEPTKSSPSDVQLSKTDQHEQQPKTIPSNPSYIDMSDPDKRFMFFKDLAAKRKAAQAAVEKKMQKSPTNPVSDLQNNTIVQKVQEETVVNVALPEKKPIKPSKDLFEKYTAPEDGQKAVSTETRVRPDVPQDSQIKDVSDNSCKEEKQVVPSKLEKTEVKDSQSAESCSMSVGEGSDGASPHTQTEEAKLPDSTTKVKVSVQTHTHTSSHILADSGPAPTKSSSQLTEKIELKPLNATSEKSNIQNPDAQQIESNVSAAPQLSESGTGITQAGVKVSSSHPSAQSSSSDQCRPDSSSQNSPSPSTSAQQTISSRLSSENARSSPGAFVLNIIPEEQVSLHPSPSESSQNKMSEESTSVIQTKFDSTLAAFSPLMSLHMPAAVDLPETEQQQSKPLLSHPSFVDMNDPQQRFIFFKELAAKRKAAQVAADKSPQKASVIPHSDSQKNSSVKKGEGVPEGAPENVTVSVTKPVTEKNATVPSVPGNVELEESQSGGSLPESADIRKDESPLQNQPQEETKLSEPVVIKSSPSRPATNAPPVDEPPHVTNYTNPDETAPSNVSSENSRSTSTSNALSPNSEKMEPQKSLSSFPSESSRDKTSGKSAISSAMQTNLGTTQVMVSPFMSKPATVELPKTDQQQSKPLLNELPPFVDMSDPQQRFMFFKELAAKRKAAQVAADNSPQKASVIPHSDSQKNSSVKKGEGVPEGAPENVAVVSVTKPITETNTTVPSVPGNIELEESQSGGSLPESADIRKDGSPLQNQPQEETKLSEPVVIKSSPSHPATNAPLVDEPPRIIHYTNPDETAPSNVSTENSSSTSTSNALSPNSEKIEPQKSLSPFPSESSRDKTSGKSAISSAMQTNLDTTQVMFSPFMPRHKPAAVELPKTDHQQSEPLLSEPPPFDLSDTQQRFMFFKELAAKRKAAEVAASIIPHSDLENNSTAKKGEATPEEASKSGSDAAVKKPITQSVYLLGKTTTVKNEQKTVAVSADDGDKAVKQDGHVINDANSTESCEEEQATVQIVPGNAELEDSQSAASLPEPVNVGTDGSPLQQQPQEDTRLSDPVGVESRPCHPPAGSPHPVDSETQNTDSTSEKPAPLTPTAETSNIQSSESQHTESNVTSSLQSSELSTSTVSEMLPCSTTQNRQSASDSDSALLSTPVETVASHVIPESSSTCMSNVLSPNAEKTETLKSVTPSPLESSKDKSLQSSRDKPAQHSTASSTVQTESASTEDEVVPSVPQPKPLAAELPKSSSSVQQYKALLSKPSHENVSELAEKQTPAQAAPEQRMENLAANPSSELQNDTIQKEEPVVEAEAVSVSSVKESISPSTALLENHTPTQDGQKIVFTEPCVSLKPDTSNKTNKQDTHVKDDPSMTKIHEEEQASVPSEVENTELKDNQSAESLPESAGGLKDGESPQSQPEEPQLSDLTTQVKESSTYHPLTTTEATHVNEPSLIDSVAPVADKSGTPTPGSASEMSTSLTPTTVPPPSVLSTLKSNVQSCGSLLLPSESNPGAPHTGSDESSDPSEPNSSSGRICPDSSSQTSPSPSVSDSALRSSSLGETVLSHTISEHSSPSPTTSVVLFPNSEETEPQKSVDVSLSESLQDKTLPSFQEKTSQNPSASSVTQADLDPTEGTSCVSEKESPESEHSSVSKSVAEESQVSSSVTPASPKEIESCLTGVTGVTNLKSGSDQDKSPLSPTVSAGHSQSTSSPVLSPNSQSDLHPSGSPSVAVASPEDAPTHATTPPELNLKDSGAPTADESVSCSTSPGSDGSPKAKKDETNMFPLPGDSDTHSPPQMPQADLSESPTETSTDCTSVPTETTLGTPADQTQSSLPHSAPKAVTSESFPSEPPVLQSDAVKESELLDPSERRPGDADAKNGVSQGNKECVSSAKANVQVSQKDTAEVTEDKVCPQSSQLKQQKSSQSRYHSSTANVISSSNLRDDTKLLLEQISANSQSRNELSKESVPAVTDDEKEDEADKKAKREIDRGITPLSRQLKTAEEREIILEKIQSMRKERKVYSRFEL